jgi:uncharacterized RDD family membrane protein YckC
MSENKTPRYAGFWVRVIADLIDSLFLDLSAGIVVLVFLGAVYWIRWIAFAGTGSSVQSDFQADFQAVHSQAPWLSGFDPVHLQLGLVGVRIVLTLIYFTGMTYKTGTTLGKRPLRIYVVNEKDGTPLTLKQSWIRCFAYALSYLPLGAGFFMAIFSPKKQGLHDWVAKTVSVKK